MGITREERNRQIAESYIAHLPRLLRLAQAQGWSHDEAEDLVQDHITQWLLMPAQDRTHPHKGKESQWLQRCIWLIGRTRCRRQLPRRAAEAEATARRPAEDIHTPLNDIIEREDEEQAKEERKEQRKLIDRILRQHATSHMCSVFHLRRRGLTYPEIAEELGCSEKTARTAMKKVLQIIQTVLRTLD